MNRFTESDRKFVLAMCEALGKRPNGQYFASVTASDITIESMDAEDDLLNVKDCYIQRREVDMPGIVPRKGIEFAVHVPVTVPGGYWEPDDVDMVEFATTTSIGDALRELWLYECANDFDNVCQGVCYELDQQVMKQLEEV